MKENVGRDGFLSSGHVAPVMEAFELLGPSRSALLSSQVRTLCKSFGCIRRHRG